MGSGPRAVLWVLAGAALAAGCTAGVSATPNTGGKDGGGMDVPVNMDAPVIDVPGVDIVTQPDAPCTQVSCTPTGGRYCGVIGDGCHKSKDCGACTGTGQACMGGICVEGPGCTRGTCDGPGGARYCGKVGTGCGEALDCGACAAGSTCSSDGVCVPANCTPTGCDIPGGGG